LDRLLLPAHLSDVLEKERVQRERIAEILDRVGR
jgi:hypothetical protein